MMLRFVRTILILPFLTAQSSCAEPFVPSGKFVGQLKLKKDAECTFPGPWQVQERFGYIDESGTGWLTVKGDCTDGASIPQWAQPFVGGPMTLRYLPAAVLHDHYSKSVRPVYGWLQTQRMFHDVLLDSHVEPELAAILYAAVLIGSKKWIVRLQGTPCDIGEICVRRYGMVAVYESEPEIYDTRAFKTQFDRAVAQIKADGATGEPAVEAIVREITGSNIYLDTLSGVIAPDFVPIATE